MMSIKRIPHFGVRKPDIVYTSRPGSYGVLFDSAGRVAIVRAPGGFHLPGGGCEPDEAPEQTLAREAMEECGLLISELIWIGEAWEYVHAEKPDRYFCKQGMFFRGRASESKDEGQESDHQLVWLSPQKSLACLNHGSHRWALLEALNNF